MISKEITVSSRYKDVCRGEPKKVNIGYNNDPPFMLVENNTLIPNKPPKTRMRGVHAYMSRTWEVLRLFFSLHNIEPNWLDCGFSWGWFDEDLGGWTGCVGKV